MMRNESTPRQAALTSSDCEGHEYKQLFLAACVVESWIYHMTDNGEPNECAMCGRCQERDKGFLLTKAFVRASIRGLDVMLWELQGKERSTQWSTFNLLRYNDRYLTMPEKNPRYCCERCYAYTSDAMRALVAEARNISLEEASRLLMTI